MTGRATQIPLLRPLGALLRAPSAFAAVLVIGLLAALSILAPELWGAVARKTSFMHSGAGPSPEHFLGTDRLGRDILARTLVATRLSLGMALTATAIAGMLGVPFGIVMAMAGPRLRALGLRVVDVLLGFPGILLAIFMTAIIGPSIEGAVIAIGVAFAPEFGRLASTLALTVGGRDYIAAARVLGIRRLRLLGRHVLPNIAETLIIAVFSTAASALIAVSSLSFLGLGVQPPQFDWGRMLVEGVESFYETPVAALAPATMIAITGLALGFFGEALARATNPLLWTAPNSLDPRGPPMPAASITPRPSAADLTGTPLLEVRGLTVRYPSAGGELTVVDSVSLDVAPGEIVGIVGESGSGKSQTALAIAKLVAHPGRVEAGRLVFAGTDLLAANPSTVARLLGRQLALVFQDPLSSLNPTLRIGTQVAEPAIVHQRLGHRSALERAAQRLAEVHIPQPQDRLLQYPHELSGGMQQRAMIAMGLMNEPALIIADEPTTALDVTVQAQVIEVLKEVNQRHGTAILLISHNLGVIAEICSRVIVMYAGRIVEDIDLAALTRGALHPYTEALLQAVPDLRHDRSTPLVAIAGTPPDPASLPRGCSFQPRCPIAETRCHDRPPPLEDVAPRHRVACWVRSSRRE
jgi:peptide/nickel transport system permease protein